MLPAATAPIPRCARDCAIEFPGGTYDHLFYVADVEARGAMTNGEIHVGLDTADFLAVFPLKHDGHWRLVGTVRDELGRPRENLSWDDVSRRVIEWMRIDVARVNWFSTYHVHHRVANHFRKGRTFLLGDAAHIHSPVGGQGMNTGIGDAVNLAWKLAAVLGERAEPVAARQLRAGADRLCPAAGCDNRSSLHRRDEQQRNGPVGATAARAAAVPAAVPIPTCAKADVPHGLADGRELPWHQPK